MTLKNCEYGIRELIKDALNHERVYPLRAPEKVTAPFVIFQRTSSDRWRSINNPSGIAQANIQIDCYALTITEAKQIAATIEETLDSYRGLVYYGADSPQSFVNIKGVSLISDTDTIDDTSEPFLYRNSADYLVTYEQ